jgi:SAM-dependent methyltransferase
VPTTESTGRTRKQLGAWYTPDELVDLVVDRTIDHTFAARAGSGRDRPVRVLDPACGDGRFLVAAARRLRALGRDARLTGVDVDPRAVAAADVPGAELITADALALDWGRRRFDVIVGNPPFLSQMSASTTRGGASRHGGGPYADAAAEFLALAIRLAEPDDGRVGLVLPQSILASRDAGPVRERATALASMNWSWWSPRHVFDAQVLVCALGFRLGKHPVARTDAQPADPAATWSGVVTGVLGVPHLPPLATDGSIGDRARCSLNFRDEYYGLVPAVSDDGDGPPLVTSGLIDPGRCRWGERPVRFAKREFAAPRVDVTRLDATMRAWALGKLVPKVLVANQTRIVEAVADPCGAWLPGVPVSSLVPTRDATVWELAAVLTSPVATAAAWLAAAGTGLSARAIRLGPAALAALPWPAGDVGPGARLLRDGDVLGCGRAIAAAYADGTAGTADRDVLFEWWSGSVNGAAVGRRGSSAAPSPASRRSSTTGRARPTR